LSWKRFRQIVDQFPQLDRVVLHGIGEPLLNKELPRFVAHLKKRGAKVLFNTNAILLNQERGDALVNAGLDELRVSLDAVSPELYAQLRGVDLLPKVIQNLKYFINRHGGHEQPKVSLWWVAMQTNLHQLPDFVRLAHQIGVGEVYLQRLVYFGSGDYLGDNTTMKAEQSIYAALEVQQAMLIKECEELSASLGMAFKASGATTPFKSVLEKGDYPWQKCQRPWRLMYISVNGTALPCCVSPFATQNYGHITLGNVFENSVEEVWTNEKYQELRQAVLSEMPDPWPCQYCGVKWSL
jgi:MoaA/NifB/PqqE/SkfB family radical SAM enzyme